MGPEFTFNNKIYHLVYFIIFVPSMGSSYSKSERTRQFIVERTAPVFNEKGYAGTSLSDLTTVTGLTKGSIYGNFENKDEVALAAFDYNFGRITAYIKDRISASDNAIERLLVYPAVYRDFMKIPFLKAGCPILNTSTEADDTHPKLRERAANALLFWKAAIEKEVSRGIKRGEINPDTDPAEFAIILTSLIEGAIMQAKVSGKTADLRVAMNFLATLIRRLEV